MVDRSVDNVEIVQDPLDAYSRVCIPFKWESGSTAIRVNKESTYTFGLVIPGY